MILAKRSGIAEVRKIGKGEEEESDAGLILIG